ncbi:MAG: DnaD domain protein, partial [Bacilli bacterium]|nr:DnaD domain protein [Bacilli bacterium]
IKTKTHQDVNVIVNVNVNVLIEYIESNLGITINGTNLEKIENLFDDYDLEILMYAVDKTIASGHRTLNYFFGIVKNWKQDGFKTLEEIKEQDGKKEKKEEWWKKYEN